MSVNTSIPPGRQTGVNSEAAARPLTVLLSINTSIPPGRQVEVYSKSAGSFVCQYLHTSRRCLSIPPYLQAGVNSEAAARPLTVLVLLSVNTFIPSGRQVRVNSEAAVRPLSVNTSIPLGRQIGVNSEAAGPLSVNTSISPYLQTEVNSEVTSWTPACRERLTQGISLGLADSPQLNLRQHRF